MSIKFHLPGLCRNFPINMLLLRMFENFPKFFREDIKIASFFGEFPTSLWNEGRYDGGDQCDAGYVQQVIKVENAAGIAIRYTFTNPTITEKDLSDPYCNFCMKAGDNGRNEVLVVSPILEEYIRKNYPSYTINSSTCKEIRSIGALNDELAKDYGLVVLDYNLNNQFAELEHITDKKRCEVLVNACCVPNCPRRGEHYRFIATQERTVLVNRNLPQTSKNRCLSGVVSTANKIFARRIENIQHIFPRKQSGKLMCQWALRILKLRGVQQIFFRLLIPTAIILQNRSTRMMQGFCC